MIASISNPRVQAARRLHRRKDRLDACRFLIEGPKPVLDALDAEWPLDELFVEGDHPEVSERATALGVSVVEVSASVMKAISDASTPQGVVAVGRIAAPPGFEKRSPSGLTLVLGEVRDPGNAGTLLRSAAAAGCDSIIFAKGSVDPWSPKVVRAAAGATFRVRTILEGELPVALAKLRSLGYRVVAADAKADLDLYEADLSSDLLALVLGNESWGLPEGAAAEVDETVSIPMPGEAESLNVAVAGSIVLFEALRQRRGLRH